ncbi:MAG: hypothetical protein PHO89_11700 [Methylacidiphilaceae bacterium]|nr:hypothetical protein [Candidatus Methylacidiphilaceae bacterium]
MKRSELPSAPPRRSRTAPRRILEATLVFDADYQKWQTSIHYLQAGDPDLEVRRFYTFADALRYLASW